MKKIWNVSLVFCVLLGTSAYAWCPPGDVNNDCRFNFDDFVLLAAGWLSEGENAVPDVLGLTQAEAETAITNAYLVVGAVTQEYSAYAVGLVCAQDPAAGTLLTPDSEVSLVVSLGLDPAGCPDITWITINDPGVTGHEAFNGEMSKYETTNAQFAHYLNAAVASGDITVSGSYVVGAEGANPGTDFAGQNYYHLAGPGITDGGVTNGGAARINWTGSDFTVDEGFENHPVTYVSWFGASAFASYYAWRLPTEWEWQAVADYDQTYTYACGATINTATANYISSTHPHGTTQVGAFGTWGYGLCDMSGNALEWTGSCYYPDCSSNSRTCRSGSWASDAYYCQVSVRIGLNPSFMNCDYGFRVCR